MQRYVHFSPVGGTILCVTESDSMDYIIPITDEQYQAYLQAPDTWCVNLETLQLYQVEIVVDPNAERDAKIKALNDEYAGYQNELQSYYVAALMNEDTVTQQDIITEREAVLAEYAASLAEITQ